MSNITTILGDSNEEDQTTENLDIVTGVLQGVVGLLNEGNFSVDEDVRQYHIHREKHIIMYIEVVDCITKKNIHGYCCPYI